MQYIVLVFIFSFFIVGCASNETQELSSNTSLHESHENMDHLGCSEEEVVNDACTRPQEGNANIDLFDTLSSVDVDVVRAEYMEGVYGFLAQPKEEGVYPAVVLIHEWWGLNENIEDMARLLAHEGYVVLAVDIYEGSIAETSDEARVLATQARENPDRAIENMENAVSYLQSLPFVQSDKIASMGWCFGGQQSLSLALASENLSGTVIYYGNVLDDTEKLKNIQWPVLGIFGAEDTGIPVESVESFSSALSALEIPNEIHIYPNVGHAFANPSGARYAPQETLDAWEKTLQFFESTLKN